MMILTAKVSKSKLLLIALLILAVILVLGLCLRNTDAPAPGTPERSTQASTNDQRVAYLRSYGWQVREEPVQTQEVSVPTEGSEVFLRYNALQKSQGFDLTQLSGKTLKRYVYEICNYPGEGSYRATLLVWKNEIVGGDICSDAAGGVMHGFQMPG